MKSALTHFERSVQLAQWGNDGYFSLAELKAMQRSSLAENILPGSCGVRPTFKDQCPFRWMR